jgi:hypothetical protein
MNMEDEIEEFIAQQVATSSRRKYDRDYYANHPDRREKVIAAAKQWALDHPEEAKAMKKKYAKLNQAQVQQRYRDRKKANNDNS